MHSLIRILVEKKSSSWSLTFVLHLPRDDSLNLNVISNYWISIKSPAMLALMKHVTLPEINARIDTFKISLLRSGQMELKPPIIIPSDPGLANPHTANVAIAELRNEINFASFISPRRWYATNSLMIVFVAITLATFSQSSDGMPRT